VFCTVVCVPCHPRRRPAAGSAVRL
jgi:hypothetical protein